MKPEDLIEDDDTDVLGQLLMDDGEKTELDKIFEQFLDPNNIGFNTELTGREIAAYRQGLTIANRFDFPMLRQGIREELILRVSKGRKGRTEWVRILSRMNDSHDRDRGWFGKRGGPE